MITSDQQRKNSLRDYIRECIKENQVESVINPGYSTQRKVKALFYSEIKLFRKKHLILVRSFSLNS